MPASALLAFLFLYASIFILVLLPVPLLLFTRRPVGIWRLLWAAGALLPTIIFYLWGRIGPTMFAVISVNWLIYIVFFYCAPRSVEVKPVRRQIAAVAAAVLILILLASIAQSVRLYHECKRQHVNCLPLADRFVETHINASGLVRRFKTFTTLRSLAPAKAG